MGSVVTRNHIYSTKQAKVDKPEPKPPTPTQAMEMDDGVWFIWLTEDHKLHDEI